MSSSTGSFTSLLIQRSRLTFAICVLAGLSAAAAQEFETPPPLEVSEILPAEMQRGENFTVQDPIHNDGFMNHYIVASDYGQFQAYGTPALAKLIQEIGALAQLDEISKSEVFVDSIKRSATGQVDAIHDFADDPVATVKGVPGGLKRSFRKYKRDAKDGYEMAKDVTGVGDVEEGAEGDEEEEGEPESASADAKELAGKTSEAAEAYAKKWFGVGGAERRWHEKMGTDPYTTNQALKSRIKELSKVDAQLVPG